MVKATELSCDCTVYKKNTTVYDTGSVNILYQIAIKNRLNNWVMKVCGECIS